MLGYHSSTGNNSSNSVELFKSISSTTRRTSADGLTSMVKLNGVLFNHPFQLEEELGIHTVGKSYLQNLRTLKENILGLEQ